MRQPGHQGKHNGKLIHGKMMAFDTMMSMTKEITPRKQLIKYIKNTKTYVPETI